MDTDEKKAATSSGLAHDEVDFTSGFETQYKKEYSILKPNMYIPPPDKKNAWYRQCSTIWMVLFLVSIFLMGTILLIVQVTTGGPLFIVITIVVYVAIAIIMIWLEVQSIKVR